jgi:hypothetical protein
VYQQSVWWLFDKKKKIDYIHFNPVSGKWNLAKDYLDYYYSSARFYETGVDEFGFLNNLFHGWRNVSCATNQGTGQAVELKIILAFTTTSFR